MYGRSIVGVNNRESLYKFRAFHSREERFENKILRSSMILFKLRHELENEIDKRLLHVFRNGLLRTGVFLEADL